MTHVDNVIYDIFHTWRIHTWFVIIHEFVIHGLFSMYGFYLTPYMSHIYMFETCKQTSYMADGGSMYDRCRIYMAYTCFAQTWAMYEPDKKIFTGSQIYTNEIYLYLKWIFEIVLISYKNNIFFLWLFILRT